MLACRWSTAPWVAASSGAAPSCARSIFRRGIITGPRFTQIVQGLPSIVPFVAPEEIDRFLDDTDLVKYAKVSAKRDECEQYLAKAVTIVTRTTPPRKTKKRKETSA